MLRATRMPLYYTIAGLFVSIKSPQLFLNKKINRLIIPFCFFILLGNMVGYVKSLIENTDFTYFSPLYYVITGDAAGKFINSPVWFLFSLFDVYIIFMLIEKWRKRSMSTHSERSNPPTFELKIGLKLA